MNREKHESYGVIEVSRVSGRAHLFDSDVEHGHFISVRICEADRERNLSNSWVHGGKVLCEFYMTEMQWAEHLSHLNIGGGTPITLRYLKGNKFAEPPVPVREEHKIKQEMQETVKDAMSALQAAMDKLSMATAPNAKALTKLEQKEVLAQITTATRELVNNLPFVLGQFEEKMEKVMVEAKTEFEGYVNNRLTNMGLNAAQLTQARESAPKLLPGEKS